MDLQYNKMADGILDDSKEQSRFQAIPYEVKLFFAVVVLLSWPMSSIYFLYQKPSVAYWFGHFEEILGAGIIIWTVIVYFIFVAKMIGRGTATVCLLVLPCTILAMSSELQELQFQFIGQALLSQDCSSHHTKVEIQGAWAAAKNVSTNCNKYLQDITGSPLEELEKIRRFENCPGYWEARAGHEKEWAYLQGLETSYQCGGWCTPDYPLWAVSKTPLDSCALAAGYAMGHSIDHMGSQVSAFSFIVIISVSLWLLVAPKWLREE